MRESSIQQQKRYVVSRLRVVRTHDSQTRLRGQQHEESRLQDHQRRLSLSFAQVNVNASYKHVYV